MSKPHEEKFCRINDTRIRFIDKGKGPAVILIHGLGASMYSWSRNIDYLSKNFRVIALDLPFFGKSEIPKVETENINYDFFSEFLVTFLHSLKIKKVAFVGHSMGGGIALNTTLKYPKIVEKLVIVSSSGLGGDVGFYSFLGHSFLNRIFLKIISKKFVARQLIKLSFYNLEKVSDIYVHSFVKWMNKPEIKKLLLEVGPKIVGLSGQKFMFNEELSEISIPTLIVWGKYDHLLPLAHGEEAHRLIKGSKFVIFDRCGHHPQIERFYKFNKILSDFLKK